jgi:putative transposase
MPLLPGGYMRHNKLALFVHLVWSTWDRLPLITPEIEPRLWQCIAAEAVRQECAVVALDGIADHVHLLLAIPSTVSIAGLVKQLKGASSHFVNHELWPDTRFRWQGSYGAFSVSRGDVDVVAAYIKRQKAHHMQGSLLLEHEPHLQA